jgi:hypothetical protein
VRDRLRISQLSIVTVLLPLAFLLRASAFYRLALPTGSLAIATLAIVWFVERALDVRIV